MSEYAKDWYYKGEEPKPAIEPFTDGEIAANQKYLRMLFVTGWNRKGEFPPEAVAIANGQDPAQARLMLERLRETISNGHPFEVIADLGVDVAPPPEDDPNITFEGFENMPDFPE